MALNVPSNASEVVSRAKVDVQRELPGSNPFLKNSWLSALIVACSNRIFDFYFALSRAMLEAIPDTAVLFLERWAAIWGIIRNAALQSEGRIAVTGTVGGLITDGITTWFTTGGNQYIASSGGTIVEENLVVGITRIANTATVTTAGEHLLSSLVSVTISGAVEPEYNGVKVITVDSATTFTFEVAGTPSQPATGTILATFTMVSIPIKSIGFGSSEDQPQDSVLTLQSPISNVDDSAGVDYGTIGGGAGLEDNDGLRDRMLDRIQNPIAHFNVSEIRQVAKSVSGVTRVFIQQITPAVGQVTIHFMRDNDDNPIPDGSEVTAVKAAIDEITPANTDTADVFVSAPIPEIQDFTFTAINPDTALMREAIENSLKLFFAEKTEVGVNIVEEAYNAAIFNTVDVTGAKVISFTLTDPPGDIAVTSGKIGQLGDVTF